MGMKLMTHIAHSPPRRRSHAFCPRVMWVMWVIENKVENGLLN